MSKAHHASYNLAFKLKIIVTEAEAIDDNSEIAIDEAINPIIYFCHVVLQVCLATRGNKCFLLVCFYKFWIAECWLISSPS